MLKLDLGIQIACLYILQPYVLASADRSIAHWDIILQMYGEGRCIYCFVVVFLHVSLFPGIVLF